MKSFERAVSAICYEVCGKHGRPGNEAYQSPYNDVTRFVVREIENMPEFQAIAVRILTLLFDSGAILHSAARFHRLEPAKRGAWWNAWAESRLGLCRDFVRLYQSLAVMALYSRPGAGGRSA